MCFGGSDKLEAELPRRWRKYHGVPALLFQAAQTSNIAKALLCTE